MNYKVLGKSLAHALLAVAATGSIALVAILAPNAFQVLGRRHNRDDWWVRREAKRKRIQEALARLRQRRLIRYEERGKETYIKITERGRSRIRQFEFNEIKLPQVKKWDGKWRVIAFDIPESKAGRRKIFRDKLNELGFYQMQKSVLVYPHYCRDEIDFLTEFLEIDKYVVYLETADLGYKEGDIREKFNLL